jgi:ribonuclease D
MTILTASSDVALLCARLRAEPYITIDTEFLRERTFWPKLCLLQLASPKEAAAIDPLADGMDLAPVVALLDDPKVLKVFHAARQDMEIFFHLTGRLPHPIFDTQVAAMVCGFGESVSYETLAARLAKASVDKSSRFTDWSHRPLSDKQLAYALSDVTHLRKIYEKLAAKLQATGRSAWVASEMDILTDPKTYAVDPESAWRRLKPRTSQPRFLNVLRAVAAWRENEARNRDVPRGRILKDEALMEIAAHPPADAAQLARIRMVGSGFAEGKLGPSLLAVVKEGVERSPNDAPSFERPEALPNGLGPLIELLRVLLKMKCDEHDVAQKLVATSSDLERIAADDGADVPALQGWRRDIFGEAALALKGGRLALAAEGRRVRLVALG